MNKYQEALDYAKKHLDSKQDIEKVEVLQGLIDKATQKENTLEFNSFKLHANGTLKNMPKDELISYINMLHHNWGVCDKQLQNVMYYAKKLQNETDKYKHEYFAMRDLIENPQPYKFEDLKPIMWVWDDEEHELTKILEAYVPDKNDNVYAKGVPIVKYGLHEFSWSYSVFEEGRFFPVTKALEYQNES